MKVGTPVPINYSPTQVWHADLVLKLNDHLGVPWNGPKLASFLETLGVAYDAWREHAKYYAEVGITSTETEQLHMFLQQGNSIVDAPAEFGWTWEETVKAMLDGFADDCSLWLLEPAQWLALEGKLLSGTTGAALQHWTTGRFPKRLTAETAERLAARYGITLKVSPTRAKPTAETWAALRCHVRGGLSVVAAAREVGISTSAAYRHLRDSSDALSQLGCTP